MKFVCFFFSLKKSKKKLKALCVQVRMNAVVVNIVGLDAIVGVIAGGIMAYLIAVKFKFLTVLILEIFKLHKYN